MSPAPPEPVPTVDDDGKVVAVQLCYQELTGEGRVDKCEPGKIYTKDDIESVISKLTEKDIQSTKGTDNPQSGTLKNCRKNKERNQGVRIDMQGRTTR